MNGVEGQESSLAAVAHELKTPLVLMRQLSFELENCSDASRRQEIIQRMRLTTERSLRLADNLSKISRLDGAMFELEPIQTSGLINEVIDELSPLSRYLKQEIIIKSSKKPLVALGNRELLFSLLIGLLDNALRCSENHNPILITTQTKNQESILSVRDNGPTIDLAQYRKLSSSLGQQSMPISARPHSSGLGLIVASRLATAMNGRLSISRHHAGGMTFAVHLPISVQLSLLRI